MRKQRGLAYYIPTWISNSPLDQHRRNDVPPPPKMNAAEHRHRRSGDGMLDIILHEMEGLSPEEKREPIDAAKAAAARELAHAAGMAEPSMPGASPASRPASPAARPAPARAAGARSLPPASPSTQRPGRTCRRTAGPAWPTRCTGGPRSSSPASTASPPSGWTAACHGSCGQDRRDGRMPTGSCEHARRHPIGRPQPFWDHWEKQTATSMLV